MEKENPPSKPRSFYSSIFLAAALLVFISQFTRLAPILFSLILILLLTLAINPLILRLRHLSGGRTVATVLVVFGFLCVVSLTGWAFYTPVERSISKFVERLPEYWERIQRPILKMEQKAVVSEKRIKQEVKTEVALEDSLKTNGPPVPEIAEKEPEPAPTPPAGGLLRTGAGALFGGVSGSFRGFASNAASILLIILTTFFGVIFTLLRPRPVIRMVFAMIPEPHHERWTRIAQRIAEFVPKWILATFTGMGIIGLMIFLATWPLFGFQDAVVLGLIALVFEAVPYIGPILASVPALLLAAGEGGLMPLWVLAAYLFVQLVENNFIMPVVVGGQLKLHPLAVIFSMLLCVTVFGVLGVLIAMPMVAIILILHEEIYRPKFLPHVSNEELEQMTSATLERKPSLNKPKKPVNPSPPDP